MFSFKWFGNEVENLCRGFIYIKKKVNCNRETDSRAPFFMKRVLLRLLSVSNNIFFFLNYFHDFIDLLKNLRKKTSTSTVQHKKRVA